MVVIFLGLMREVEIKMNLLESPNELPYFHLLRDIKYSSYWILIQNCGCRSFQRRYRSTHSQESFYLYSQLGWQDWREYYYRITSFHIVRPESQLRAEEFLLRWVDFRVEYWTTKYMVQYLTISDLALRATSRWVQNYQRWILQAKFPNNLYSSSII
jgi:hypothetical protein